jgi:hypothetical protein
MTLSRVIATTGDLSIETLSRKPPEYNASVTPIEGRFAYSCCVRHRIEAIPLAFASPAFGTVPDVPVI